MEHECRNSNTLISSNSELGFFMATQKMLYYVYNIVVIVAEGRRTKTILFVEIVRNRFRNHKALLVRPLDLCLCLAKLHR